MLTSGITGPCDPTVFASNEAILRRRFPDLAALVESYSGQWQRSIRTHTSSSGFPTISVESGQAWVHVHSTYQPAVEAQRWLEEPLNADWNTAIILGMGLGYHLDALLERRPNCRVIIVEPRLDVFYAALALKDQRRLLSHRSLGLIVTDDPIAAAHQLFHKQREALLDEATTFVWPATTRYAAGFREVFESQLVDVLRASRGNIATTAIFQSQWIDNFFENVALAVNDPGIASLGQQLAGHPAIIVSAGPSLEKNGHLLAEAKGKAVIIAAGSAIHPLLTHGVEPDLLVSFDPGEFNYRHFEQLHTRTIPLVYVPTIFPRILKEYLGPRFTAAMNTFPFISWVFRELGEEKGLLSSGPSIANVCWHLANVLGLNPIILVGQDLAFTDGKTHAAGVVHARTVDLHSPNEQDCYVSTEGIDGSPVLTSRAMYNMKVWFEQRLMSTRNGLITIDSTEGGAKINGTVIMPLREALVEYCRELVHPHSTIMHVHYEESQRLDHHRYAQRLHDLFEQLNAQMQSILELSEEGLAVAKVLLRESSLRKLSEKRLNEATARLGRHTKKIADTPAYTLFIEPVIAHVIEAVSVVMQARLKKEANLHRQGAQVARQYVALFTSVRDIVRHIHRLLKHQAKVNTFIPKDPPIRTS